MVENIENKQNGQFGIQKVYIKNISFETPNSPMIFKEQWNPSVNMDLQNTSRVLDQETYEVTLSVTVTVNFDEKTVYLAEVEQAGIFNITGMEKDVLARILGTVCPNILFPFAREFVSDLVTRGGFPQLLLSPVNFDAIYLHQQQANQGQQEEAR